MTKKKLIEDIVADPTRFHRAPIDVIRDRRFNDGERFQILAAWETWLQSEDEVTRDPSFDPSPISKAIADAREEIRRRNQPPS